MGHASSGVSGQRGIGMCRHLYFRNDFDLAGIRIGNNLFHILLCVKSAYVCRFTRFSIFALGEIPFACNPPGTDFR